MYKLLVGVLMLAAVSFGDIIYVGTSVPDLEHPLAVQWNVNINSALSAATARGEVLVSAELYIVDLWNRDEPELDALYVNLLDVTTSGQSVLTYADNVPGTVNYFAGTNTAWTTSVLVDTYSQEGWVSQNYMATLDVGLINQFRADNGFIGIGLDPDCSYTFNRDLSMLVLTTAPTSVPEPPLLSLLGCGLLGLAFIRRRK